MHVEIGTCISQYEVLQRVLGIRVAFYYFHASPSSPLGLCARSKSHSRLLTRVVLEQLSLMLVSSVSLQDASIRGTLLL